MEYCTQKNKNSFIQYFWDPGASNDFVPVHIRENANEWNELSSQMKLQQIFILFDRRRAVQSITLPYARKEYNKEKEELKQKRGENLTIPKYLDFIDY